MGPGRVYGIPGRIDVATSAPAGAARRHRCPSAGRSPGAPRPGDAAYGGVPATGGLLGVGLPGASSISAEPAGRSVRADVDLAYPPGPTRGEASGAGSGR